LFPEIRARPRRWPYLPHCLGCFDRCRPDAWKDRRRKLEEHLPGQIRERMRSLVMLYTLAVILLILWLAGWLGFHILGSFIHILVVLAIIALVLAVLKKV